MPKALSQGPPEADLLPFCMLEIHTSQCHERANVNPLVCSILDRGCQIGKNPISLERQVLFPELAELTLTRNDNTLPWKQSSVEQG